MMGVKARVFHPLLNVSLDDLVPRDHFYRHVERTLDLSFVRDLVRHLYAGTGRPSVDPVVFFKLHLVMFFEGMRSEQQLERVGADRLNVRWYLGYDLHEPLPDHPRLTRIRDRYGVEIFRQFFERVVDWCQREGLVWGKELYADATLVEADADRDKMLPALPSSAISMACLLRLPRLHLKRAHQPKRLRSRAARLPPCLTCSRDRLSLAPSYRPNKPRVFRRRQRLDTAGMPRTANLTAVFSAGATSE